MTTREDKEYFIRLWNEGFHMNNLGCGTPLYAVIIVGVLFLLFSCATKKKFVENEHIKTEIRKDSINTKVVQKDSTGTFQKTEKNEKEVISTDKEVEKSDSTVTTVDTNGNIIKQETWHNRKEIVSSNREYERILKDSIASLRLVKDSLEYYMEMCDSLLENDFHREYTVIEKQKIPKWCYYCLGVCVLFIIFAFIKFVRWLQIR